MRKQGGRENHTGAECLKWLLVQESTLMLGGKGLPVGNVQGSFLLFRWLVSGLNCPLLSEMWHVDTAQNGFIGEEENSS